MLKYTIWKKRSECYFVWVYILTFFPKRIDVMYKIVFAQPHYTNKLMHL